MTSARLPDIQKSPGAVRITTRPHALRKENSDSKENNQVAFKLTNTGSVYKLPNPRDLKPFVDSETGTIDTWPAHATKPALPLDFRGQNNKGPPKPKFLNRLENFLIKELRALNCIDPDIPSEKRLQAYREVFEYLIDDFKTYRPLLSSIKNEYEKLIEHQKERIRELEPLQTLIITISERCDKKLMSIKQDEIGEIADLKVENERLRKKMMKLREDEDALKEQVKKLQEEIALEYRRYRDECDARKLLIQDLNEIKYQQDEAKRASLGKDQEGGGEDIVMLKMALKKTREDLEAKTQKLAEVLADFGDVVPRRDFERLDAKFKVLEEEMAILKKDYQTLVDDHSSLISVHKKIVEQRDHLAQECEGMRRCATPRPEWDKCAKYIEGGEERWKELSKDKSSEDLMNTLLAEMTGQDIAIIKAGAGAANEFFTGMGSGTDIPRYLRCDGQIINRRIGKRDTTMLIKDIWRERVENMRDKPNEEQEEFSDFVFNFLRARFGTDALAYEWGYNLYDAGSRYNHDPKIRLFISILGGEADERLYHDHCSTLERLSRAVSQEADNKGGIISPEKLRKVLKDCFPWKDDDSIDDLMTAAEKDHDSITNGFEYKTLFAEDDEGHSGSFTDKIEEQDKAERYSYVKELEEELGAESTPTLEDVRKAFVAIDSGISQEICQRYLERGFGLQAERLNSNVKVEKDVLVANLKSGSIRRVSERT
eukprot:Seg2867.2 transcript_id=Seg2867.2/GoldUCD/mRNA.D3Y31 product="Translin-associated factor X-interacting protein 1" protein_id=Seg2867.2/GoldUCD/D3Y31